MQIICELIKVIKEKFFRTPDVDNTIIEIDNSFFSWKANNFLQFDMTGINKVMVNHNNNNILNSGANDF